MGLDIVPGGARWPYQGFHAFRKRLAWQVGISLDEMEGFGGQRKWSKIRDPLVPLLDHSDCDGVLTPRECRRVAPRLAEVIADWPPDDWDTRQARLLIAGMKTAIQTRRNLVFC